ncbi:MAG TPA: peptidase domain-containing ABC transporter [Longimicrobiaceae bacterium]|nr:peptidase domain-containing ABC transporter [Longimicrobiaceae bacterium]
MGASLAEPRGRGSPLRAGRIPWVPRWRRLPRKRQHDRSDCAAACLASVAEHHGLRVPTARIRQRAFTDEMGTTVLGLQECAEALGFRAKGVRAPLESLSAIPLPAIAHVVTDGVATHFVVVYRVTRTTVVVMDPRDGGVHRIPVARFGEQWTGVLLILVPSERFQPLDSTVSVGKRFWTLVRPHRSVMLQALLGAAIYTLLGLSTAIYVQKLIDHVLPDGNRNLLNLLGVVMLGILAAQTVVGWLKDVFMLRTGQKIDAGLILGYYQHVLRLPQRFFDSMRVGEIIARVNDAVKIRAFINEVAVDLAVNVLVVVCSLSLMFLYSWRLALLLAAALPLYAVMYWITNRLNRRIQRKLMESAADLESQLVESVSSAATVKRFGLEAHEGERMERRFVRVLRNVYASTTTSVASRGASSLLAKLSVILLLWVGGLMVIDRLMTAGELMSFYALAGYLAGPVVAVVGANRTLQEAVIAADRLFEILDLEQESAGIAARLLPATPGEIGFERVTFRYGGRERALAGLNLTIPAGSFTALVGESGSGKSTVAALLQGIYAPNEGRVRIGGHDIRHLDPASLREMVVAVPQQIHLFAGTVLENIALGARDPDVRRAPQLWEELGIADFSEALPQGFRTELGENGLRLSGGQRQRLAIARALYRGPRILILDEATSSLDSHSESYVQRVLQRLRREGRTVIVIAHRLASVRTADRIAVLERGALAEVGSHEELLRGRGAYWKMWQRQVFGAEGLEAELTAGAV